MTVVCETAFTMNLGMHEENVKNKWRSCDTEIENCEYKGILQFCEGSEIQKEVSRF